MLCRFRASANIRKASALKRIYVRSRPQIADRRQQKEGANCIIFTSNKSPNKWISSFHEYDTLLCALDRSFDAATVFLFKGESYRGRNLKTVALTIGRTLIKEIADDRL